MAIVFKTYNGRHQLHLMNEVWVLKSKQQLDELLALFPKQEMSKLHITPVGKDIEVEVKGVIIDCKDTKELKLKFGQFVDLKEKAQKKSL